MKLFFAVLFMFVFHLPAFAQTRAETMYGGEDLALSFRSLKAAVVEGNIRLSYSNATNSMKIAIGTSGVLVGVASNLALMKPLIWQRTITGWNLQFAVAFGYHKTTSYTRLRLIKERLLGGPKIPPYVTGSSTWRKFTVPEAPLRKTMRISGRSIGLTVLLGGGLILADGILPDGNLPGEVLRTIFEYVDVFNKTIFTFNPSVTFEDSSLNAFFKTEGFFQFLTLNEDEAVKWMQNDPELKNKVVNTLNLIVASQSSDAEES